MEAAEDMEAVRADEVALEAAEDMETVRAAEAALEAEAAAGEASVTEVAAEEDLVIEEEVKIRDCSQPLLKFALRYPRNICLSRTEATFAEVLGHR